VISIPSQAWPDQSLIHASQILSWSKGEQPSVCVSPEGFELMWCYHFASHATNLPRLQVEYI
jgi:hypothetical protein